MENIKYEWFDECRGKVTSVCKKGAFLTLDNGESAFAYRFGNLKQGENVRCTYIKPAGKGSHAQVTIDSVDSVWEYAA